MLKELVGKYCKLRNGERSEEVLKLMEGYSLSYPYKCDGTTYTEKGESYMDMKNDVDIIGPWEEEESESAPKQEICDCIKWIGFEEKNPQNGQDIIVAYKPGNHWRFDHTTFVNEHIGILANSILNPRYWTPMPWFDRNIK